MHKIELIAQDGEDRRSGGADAWLKPQSEFSDPFGPRHPWRKAAIAAAILMFAGFTGASGYFLYLKSGPPPPAYRTIQPKRTNIRQTIRANGMILPRKEVNTKPQISGIIEKIVVDRGDLVQSGDLIAVIRPLPNPGSVNAAEVEVRNARIAHLQLQREFERVAALLRKDFVSRAEFDKAQRDLHLAEQRVTAAQRHLEIVKTGASTALGRSASEVRATVSGTILERPVEQGAVVVETNAFNEGTTIVSIADMSDLIFRGKVDEPDAGNLRIGMPVSVTVGALPNESFEGILEFVAPKAMEKEGLTTFEIRVTLKLKPGQFVRAGYSATADVVVAERQHVLSLPERVIRFQDGRAYVTLDGLSGMSEQRAVTLGLSDGITTEILSGLTENDRVRIEN